MPHEDSIFEDGENLQAAIATSLQQKKALLCFVSDDGDESTQWEVALLDDDIKQRLQRTTVSLRLRAGSDQAGFLNAVCPVRSVPATIIIFNAQVVANFQHGQTKLDEFQNQLKSRYGSVAASTASAASKPKLQGYIHLPSSEGRMHLPNNAYDHFRELTQKYLDSDVSGKGLLHIQLRLLQSLKNESIDEAVTDVQAQMQLAEEPILPDEVINRLLNTPASSMRLNFSSTDDTLHLTGTSSTTTHATASQAQGQQASENQMTSSAVAVANSRSNSTTASTACSDAQRNEYVQAQKAAEAERARTKAQVDADKKARREADRKAREDAEAVRRRIELYNLRKANSTTSDPKATDVRIQVRLFDGSTIRSAFAAESTISKDLRPWIDGEITKKAVSGGSAAGQPYNLKLILTPLPNRAIEAGEEDEALSDVEGVRGSATLIIVPVRSYVESYEASQSGIAGVAQTVVGTGVGVVGTAAGMLLGGLGRLMGVGRFIQQPASSSQSQTPSESNMASPANDRSVRVRTLADQRRDEENEARRRGEDLYNGMGLNVQPRRDDDKKD